MSGLFRRAVSAMGLAIAALGAFCTGGTSGRGKQAPSGQYKGLSAGKQSRREYIGKGMGRSSSGTSMALHNSRMAAKRLVRRKMAKASRKVNYKLCKMG